MNQKVRDTVINLVIIGAILLFEAVRIVWIGY